MATVIGHHAASIALSEAQSRGSAALGRLFKTYAPSKSRRGRIPKYKRLKRRRKYSNMRMRKSAGLFRSRALNPVSNYRVIHYRAITSLSTTVSFFKGIVLHMNGVNMPALGFAITTNPFVNISTVGTEPCYSPVVVYSQSADHSCYPKIDATLPQTDLINAVKRYATARVVSMRVQLYLAPNSLDVTGAVGDQFKDRACLVRTGWDPLDTVPTKTEPCAATGDAVLDDYPTPDQLARFPYHKEFIAQVGAYASPALKQPARKFVLFSRKFKPEKAPELINKTAASSTAAVLPGGIDNRSIFTTGVNDAFDALRVCSNRSGKLHTWITPAVPTNNVVSLSEWLGGNDDYFGKVITYHTIVVKDDLDGIGRGQV